MQWLAVAAGGALGALLRFTISTYWLPVQGGQFPWATFLINIFGSFLIGVSYIVIVEKGVWPIEWKWILIAGFLGAFTTFSTFSLEAITLWLQHQPGTAIMYVLSSVFGGLLAAALGLHLAPKWF
ncbi:fluoride efflux transporter CrcB [Marinibactrum halimedae]|uniref:Fluoride-specific ion channel FluC n=1 Tax=Marinibactrum halimedae TaxID=1444977 RepID=A0AA37WQI6_9GAMM|nr:fluoride efflux transporter CrcB [Marinibactrum halimedae]MCD9460957.1 fluoride efflux transporter CrcB [Marinibactrum halimedae]GLS28101.1 putative fluoride ion transporter CrcB [Marinibactrum halimedae]